jgi:hypothetical protein
VSVHCNSCGTLLAEGTSVADPRQPCSACGSTARRFHEELVEKCEVEDFLGMEGRRAGVSRRKGWFILSFTRLVPQVSRGGALAYHTRVMDRDRYVETVTMRETGEVVHHAKNPERASRPRVCSATGTNAAGRSGIDADRLPPSELLSAACAAVLKRADRRTTATAAQRALAALLSICRASPPISHLVEEIRSTDGWQ